MADIENSPELNTEISTDINENFNTIKTLLNSIRAQGILNTSDVDKLLTGINTKLEKINTDEDIDLIKVFLTELKQTLDSAKSKIQEAEDKVPDVVYIPQKSTSNNYSSIISNRSDSEIENYISNYVRPLYNEVNNNIGTYSKSTSGGASYWRDSKGYIKKTFSSGTNGYNLSREYYYDTDSGRIAFAFLYGGGSEYRLYFRTNQLVRYIGPNGTVVNNPTASNALQMANYVLSEAY